jgi:LuxR family maltose regulon positive regulatory protein
MSVLNVNNPILQGKLSMPDAGSLVHRPQLLQILNEHLELSLSVITAPAGYGKTSLVCDWLAHNNFPYCWFSIDKNNNQPRSFWTYLCAALKRVDAGITGKAEGLLENSVITDYSLISDTLIEALEKITRKWDRPQKIIMVLDSFHHLDHPQILDPLQRFLDYLPNWVHVVITSRNLPKLNIPSRVSKVKAHVIYSRNLAFSHEQMADFLQSKLSLNLTPDELQHIFDKTQGWAAAIQLVGIAIKSGVNLVKVNEAPELALLSPRKNAVLEQDSLLADFLFEDVFLQLDEPLRQVLLGLSVVDSFNADSSDVINKIDNSEVQIKTLLDTGLFVVRLSHEHNRYRLHTLFRDWLFNYGQTINKDHMLKCQQRAIAWLNEHGCFDDALNVAFTIQDWPLVAGIMRKLYPSIIQMGRLDYASRILKNIPIHVMNAMPHLNMLQAVMCFNQYQYEEAQTFLEKVEVNIKHFYKNTEPLQQQKNLTDMGLENVQDITLLATGVKVLQSQMARFNGDSARAQALDSEVLSDSRLNDDHLLCWAHYGKLVDCFINDDIANSIQHGKKAIALAKQVNDGFCVTATLGWLLQALYHNGKIREAVALAEKYFFWLTKNALLDTPNISTLYGTMVTLYIELNQLTLAWKYYYLSVDAIQPFTEPREIIFSRYYCHLQLLTVSGLWNEARECLQALEEYELTTFNREQSLPTDTIFSVLLNTKTLSALVDMQSGNYLPLVLLSNTDPDLSVHQCNFRYQYECFIQVVGKMLMGCDEEEALNTIEQHSQQQGVLTRQVDCHLLPANILFSQGEEAQALVHFTKAIKLAATGDFVNLVLQKGPSMKPLIEQALAEGIETHYCQKLLQDITKNQNTDFKALSQPSGFVIDMAESIEYKAEHKADAGIHKPALGDASLNQYKQGLMAQLSPRELQVLHQLSLGGRNKDMALALNLSVSTVKRHLQNVYGKLQVGSRTEALILFNQHASTVL